jgi:hypothetical protein
MEYNTELELENYKKIREFIKTLPLDVPWRGVMCMNILNGFLEVAMKTDEEDPHAVMEALDHMFVQMVEVYKSGDTSILTGESDQIPVSESSTSDS